MSYVESLEKDQLRQAGRWTLANIFGKVLLLGDHGND